jgi:hypothetical protein
MPPIFKALATIAAWALFIGAWLIILVTLIAMGIRGDLFSSEALGLKDAIAFALSIVGMVLSVVVMILRKKME